MRNDARPVGEHAQEAAQESMDRQESDRTKDREPAEGRRDLHEPRAQHRDRPDDTRPGKHPTNDVDARG